MKFRVMGRMAGVSLSAAISFNASAQAADMPRGPVRSPAVHAAYDWTGFYAGAELGGVFVRDNVTTPGGGLLSPIPIYGGSAFAGGFLGYNYQMGSLVVGVDADLASVFASRAASASQPTVIAGVFGRGEVKPKVLASVSARLGYAMDNWLLYGKVGGAWMKADYTGSVETAGGATLATQTLSATRNGWLLGAGLEYGWSRNWVSRLEYNYLNFGSKTLNYALPVFVAADIETKVHVVKLGLAYKFGGL